MKTYYLRDFEDCTYMYYERQPPWWRLLVHIIFCDEIRIFIILFPRRSKSPRFCHACFFSSHTKQICFILYFVEVIDEPQISIDFFFNQQYIYLFVCQYIIWKGTYLSIDFLFNAIRYKTMWSFVGPPIYNSNRYKIWVVRHKMFTPLSI